MFSKNNTKMNDKKQFEKINHYGIKKFNAGTASVLIASAFMFLGGAAQASDTNKQEATVATTEKVEAEKSTEEKVETKPAVAEKATEVKEVEAAPKAEAKKEVNKATLQAKISQLDNLFVSLAGQELSEDKQVKTVSAAVELNKAKDLAASASATQEQVDTQVAALEAAINNLNKVEKAADKNLFTKIAEIVQEISETVNLEEAEVIVSGGRGMGSKENFELVKQLAEVCGGVVGATRPATEDEWIPRSHQVGQSGKIVAPKLYIACGISGATQHVSGIMGSNYIVAINKDEDAPIFEVADVGIVGNVMDIIPIMIEEIKKIKS